MKYERLVAMMSLALIVIVALIVAATENVDWAKDVALVGVGGLAGVISAPMLSNKEE